MAVGGGSAPNACAFVSVAEVSALTGKPAGGGQISTVDNVKSVAASCMYTGSPMVIVQVADYPSAAAAKAELATEQQNGQGNVAESGVGDAAFSTSVGALAITAVRGVRVATIAIIGGAPALHGQLHALMVKALAR
jgi:hypothetical protein